MSNFNQLLAFRRFLVETNQYQGELKTRIDTLIMEAGTRLLDTIEEQL